MVKFLLLALAFGLANAHHHPKIAGKWVTIAIAADNEEGKKLRLYPCELFCNKDFSEMDVTFYVKANGQCSKKTLIGYRKEDATQFEDDNILEPLYVTSENIVFFRKTVDRSGLETKLNFVVGKGEPLIPKQHAKCEAFAEEHDISAENIQDVLATDTCPK